MSHPYTMHDPDNVRKQDSHWAKKEEPSSAKGIALKKKANRSKGDKKSEEPSSKK